MSLHCDPPDWKPHVHPLAIRSGYSCFCGFSGHYEETTPAKLAPPKGSELVGNYTAKGVQIYVCRVKGAANEWGFKAPEAELTDAQDRLFAKHYAGPTWETSDGSKIVGRSW